MSPYQQTLPPPPVPAFTGGGLDRAAKLRRDPGRVRQLLRDVRARALFATDDAVLVAADGSALCRRELLESLVCDQPDEPVLLGLDGGAPLFGFDLDALAPAAAGVLLSAGRLVSLRDAGATLPQPEGGLAAYLAALIGWHRHHRHCPNCGSPTDGEEGGLARHCPRCGRSHFPRTDPVVIVAVHAGDRLLMGRRSGWPADRYSVLAGFVSPGETPEEAVVREVLEESGVRARSPRYLAAQPWPFPFSLMLGYVAEADGEEPHVGDGELEDVGWFNRELVRAAARCVPGEGATLQLPSEVSIARSLIEWWLEAPAASNPTAAGA